MRRLAGLRRHPRPRPRRAADRASRAAATRYGETVLIRAAHSGTFGLHPEVASLWLALAVIAFVVCVGAVIVPLLGVAVSGARGGLRSWRGRHQRLSAAAHVEARARATMSELCPHGWRAQITLFADAGKAQDDH